MLITQFFSNISSVGAEKIKKNYEKKWAGNIEKTESKN